MSIMLIDLYVAGNDKYGLQSKEESSAVRKVKQLVKEDIFCVGEDDFLNVRRDNNAMNYMIHQICTKVSHSEAKAYLLNTYGEIDEKLGSGSFGNVYAFKKDDHKTAIKIPKVFKYKELFVELNSSECLKHFVEEENWNDYGLVKECLWLEGKNTPYLIMNYFKHTFAYKIKKKYTLGWENYNTVKKYKAVYDMLVMTEQLHLLHINKIAHRDIKSENLMITPYPELRPVLVDFGMTTTNGYNTKTLCGTPFYIDYEVINGNGTGISSDIFSLFTLFAEIFKGLNQIEFLVNKMQTNARLEEAMKGKAIYKPNFSVLQVPTDFEWTWNMFKPTNQGRWGTKNVYAALTKMINALKAEIKQTKKLV